MSPGSSDSQAPNRCIGGSRRSRRQPFGEQRRLAEAGWCRDERQPRCGPAVQALAEPRSRYQATSRPRDKELRLEQSGWHESLSSRLIAPGCGDSLINGYDVVSATSLTQPRTRDGRSDDGGLSPTTRAVRPEGENVRRDGRGVRPRGKTSQAGFDQAGRRDRDLSALSAGTFLPSPVQVSIVLSGSGPRPQLGLVAEIMRRCGRDHVIVS